MSAPIPNFLAALNAIKDDDGFIPFKVAKFAAIAASVESSFKDEYSDVYALVGDVGIEAMEFAIWYTEATGQGGVDALTLKP